MTNTVPRVAPGDSPRDMAAPLLEVSNLEVGYGDASAALRGVSLAVPEGGSIAILGSNGAGKTTTIRAISGLLRVHRGSIRKGDITFAGESISRMPTERIVARGIAQVPEGRMLFGTLTVEENLRTGAAAGREPDVRAALDRVMDLFPVLGERRNQQAGWMSGGEQQMIAIGRALMASPRLLLLDELSLGLAPIVLERIVEQLHDVRRRLGTSTLVVEQNAKLALGFTDYAYIMENGRIVLEGPSDDLVSDPQVQEAYLGIGQTEGKVQRRPSRKEWWL